jgi:hypothetical protein
MFGHKREEVTGHWKQFYNVGLYGLWFVPLTKFYLSGKNKEDDTGGK